MLSSALDTLSLQELSEAIEALYGTVTDAQRWPEALWRIGQAVSGTQTLLFASGADGSSEALRCNNTADEVLFPFLAHYSTVNVLAEPCDRMFADGTVRYSHLAVPDPVFEHSEFYQDFFRPNGLFYSSGIKRHTSDGALTYLSVQRPRRRRPFTEEEGARLALLMPHLQRALELRAALRRKAEEADGADAALAAFGQAVVGVDAAARIVYASAAGESLLRDGTVVFAANGKLRARSPRADGQLQARLRAVLDLGAAFVSGPQQAVLLDDPRTGTPLRLVILPRRTVPRGNGITMEALVCFSGAACGGPSSRQGSMRSLYQLTATECRVADLLLAGNDPKELAEILHITANTARFHLKRIMAKTGVRRQAELIRLMAELPLDPAG
jgi:DNA-binding CsgD family transcriptional regulator